MFTSFHACLLVTIENDLAQILNKGIVRTFTRTPVSVTVVDHGRILTVGDLSHLDLSVYSRQCVEKPDWEFLQEDGYNNLIVTLSTVQKVEVYMSPIKIFTRADVTQSVILTHNGQAFMMLTTPKSIGLI